jgi:hypothetical protein
MLPWAYTTSHYDVLFVIVALGITITYLVNGSDWKEW